MMELHAVFRDKAQPLQFLSKRVIRATLDGFAGQPASK